jgi:cytochrome c oxidase subunit II
MTDLVFADTTRILAGCWAALAFDSHLEHGRHAILHPAGPEAGRIEWLYWLIFWISLVVFVFMMVGYTIAARRNLSRVSDRTFVIEDEPGDKRSAWFVGIAVGITTATLFLVLALSVSAGRKVQDVAGNGPIAIQVTGHQWWWEVNYPNSEPDLRVTTANEIHVPLHERVNLILQSGDVIHSFWAPNITGKRDLIPGYSSSISFQVDTPGVYHGQCAEFCGLQHAHMGFSIVAESREDFDAWQRDQLQPAPEPADPQAARGKQVFLTHPCVMCHTIRGTDAGSNMGPDLTHIASRPRIAADTLPNTPGALGGWILDPQAAKPGNHMAPNSLTGDELQALLSYLQTLN